MLFSRKSGIIMILFTLSVLLAGCTAGQSVEEKMYEHLEQAVTLEQGFADVQQPLVEAEEKEQKLFSEIMTLSMKEFEQIKKMADEASGLAETRQELLQKEKESIDTAYEEFKSIEEMVDQLEEENLKSIAKELTQKMKDRHESYNKLNEAYSKALKMDLELYAMLKKEDLSLDELKAFTEELNLQYDEVLKSQNEFNALTDEYNEKKQTFYQEAGFTTEKPDAA
ncbi:YkyA family protein [Pseudalkalibacillus sp. SCS-8]|uniref:YkyA family protein n=1 Tax=Pseudalkalibacillus nanhaiensis TaxID=3115291 RepID=UPI0032DA136E